MEVMDELRPKNYHVHISNKSLFLSSMSYHQRVLQRDPERVVIYQEVKAILF